MKTSFIITTIAICVAVVVGWVYKRQLSDKQEANAKLVSEATALGIVSDSVVPNNKSRVVRRSKAPETNPEAKALAQEFIALVRSFDALKNPNDESSKEYFKKFREMSDRVKEMNLSQFRSFLTSYAEITDIKGRDEDNLYRVIYSFAMENMVETAELISSSPQTLENNKSLINKVLYQIISNAVYNEDNIADAFQSLAYAEPSSHDQWLGSIMFELVETKKSRTEALEAMRDFAVSPEQMELAKKYMDDITFGDGTDKLSFNEVSTWMDSYNLTTEERAAATKDMQKKIRVGETGQWLDWLAKTDIPDEASKERAFDLATQWTRKDYQAAGKWINNTPDGPVKSAVISAYAAMSHPYDPEGAKQWLQTLPQGPDRTRALETIYQGMQKNENYAYDKETVEAFAREHGFSK